MAVRLILGVPDQRSADLLQQVADALGCCAAVREEREKEAEVPPVQSDNCHTPGYGGEGTLEE